MSQLPGMLGFKELDELLKTLPAKVEQNILRGALRAGQKPILDRARLEINSRSGDLSRSLRIRTKSKKGEVTATLVAGDKKAFYAHMVEFGTAQHFIKPKTAKSLFFAGINREVIDHPGAIAHPFMRTAADTESDNAVKVFGEYVKKRLPRELKKAGL